MCATTTTTTPHRTTTTPRAIQIKHRPNTAAPVPGKYCVNYAEIIAYRQHFTSAGFGTICESDTADGFIVQSTPTDHPERKTATRAAPAGAAAAAAEQQKSKAHACTLTYCSKPMTPIKQPSGTAGCPHTHTHKYKYIFVCTYLCANVCSCVFDTSRGLVYHLNYI